LAENRTYESVQKNKKEAADKNAFEKLINIVVVNQQNGEATNPNDGTLYAKVENNGVGDDDKKRYRNLMEWESSNKKIRKIQGFRGYPLLLLVLP
jgi:hypothetical protein